MNGGTKSKACLLLSIFLLGLACSSAAGRTIYVDTDASGANDGSSWADAYNYLQDALTDANSALKPVEIRVAEGIYTPDSNSTDPNGSGDREATFQLINGVTLKGGYAGFGEPDPNARDIELYETILSGDLNWDDDGYLNRDENSYHVLIASQTDASAVLDGFTVMGGNADGLDEDHYGGGIYNESGSPALIDCTFTSNSASYYDEPTWCGGGMANFNGSPTLTNCTFSDNWAGSAGGMYNEFSSVTLVNCTFIRNGRDGIENYHSDVTALDCIFSYNDGCGCSISGENTHTFTNCIFTSNTEWGMVAGYDSTAILTNCIFVRNSAYRGGGMKNVGVATLINCVFRENWATDDGGGLYNALGSASLFGCVFIANEARGASGYEGNGGGIHNYYGSITLTNCIFKENKAHDYGGGIDSTESTLTMDNCMFAGNSANRSGGGLSARNWSTTEMDNCTFVGNSAPDGKALACDSFSQKYPSSLQLMNCILWDGGNEIWNDDGSTITITYSDVESGWPGEGNIDIDPCFVEPGYWDQNDTPDQPWDDFWVDGDYHLLAGSPCIDAGDPNYVAGPNETDLDGKPRIIGGRIDMGAYEYSPPIQADVRIVPRTISLASSGKWIAAFLRLPEEYNIADIDPNSIFLENEIEPERFWLSEDNQIALIKFDREQVRNILSVGKIELTITGYLMDGQLFDGTDTIRILNKGGRKSAKWRK
jgi:hypothetical protein